MSVLVDRRIVWPVRVLSSLTAPMLRPVKETGIVFYVYSKDGCEQGNRYMDQVERNAKAILEMEPNVDMHLMCFTVGEYCVDHQL